MSYYILYHQALSNSRQGLFYVLQYLNDSGITNMFIL